MSWGKHIKENKITDDEEITRLLLTLTTNKKKLKPSTAMDFFLGELASPKLLLEQGPQEVIDGCLFGSQEVTDLVLRQL